jgi:post-segregation antitoxin (ccd killing protein)
MCIRIGIVCMAARLNITIPDELQERLHAAKEIQPDLNVSAICQEAIEMTVKLVEVRQSAGSKREQAIKRLNLQIRRGQREWYSKGKKDGFNDALDLNYEDFTVVAELSSTVIDPLHIVAIQERSRAIEKSSVRLECPHPMKIAYYAGWIDGVLEFWNDIKDELAIDELAFGDFGDE